MPPTPTPPAQIAVLFMGAHEPFTLELRPHLDSLALSGLVAAPKYVRVTSSSHLHEELAGAHVLLVMACPAIEGERVARMPLLEALRMRHGRSAWVIPVAVESVTNVWCEGLGEPVPRVGPAAADAADRHEVWRQACYAAAHAAGKLASLPVRWAPPAGPAVDRPRVLSAIQEAFESASPRVCLVGPHGRGVSSVAAAYAATLGRDDHPGGALFWSMSGDDEEDLLLAKGLGLAVPPVNEQSVVAPIRALVDSRPHCLVVCDSPSGPIPSDLRAAVLWLQPACPAHRDGPIIEVPPLSREEAFIAAEKLLLKATPRAVVEELARLSAGEPLAITLGASILARTSDLTSDTLRALEKAILLADVPHVGRDPEDFSASLDPAKRSSPGMAFFDPCWTAPVKGALDLAWTSLSAREQRLVTLLCLGPRPTPMPLSRIARFSGNDKDLGQVIANLERAGWVERALGGGLSATAAVHAYLCQFQPPIHGAAPQGSSPGPRHDLLQDVINNVRAAYADPAAIDREVVAHGIDAVLAELNALRPMAGCLPDDLATLRSILEALAPRLSGWRPAQAPSMFLQLLQNHAVARGDHDLAGAALRALDRRGLSYLADRFPAGRSPAGLLRMSRERPTSWSLRVAHTGTIRAIAASASGAVAVTCGTDGRLLLWDVPNGACIGVLEGHTGAVHHVAMDASGQVAVSGGEDGGVRIWDFRAAAAASARGGHGPATRGHRTEVTCVSVSQQGTWAASGGVSGTIRVWRLADGAAVGEVHGHRGRVSAVVTFGERAFASAGEDGMLRLFSVDADRIALVSEVDLGGGHAISALSARPDAIAALVTATTDPKQPVSRVLVWKGPPDVLSAQSPSGPAEARASAVSDAPVEAFGIGPWSAVALHPEKDVIALGTRSGDVGIWDVSSGEQLASRPGLQTVSALVFAGPTRLLACQMDALRILDLHVPRIGPPPAPPEGAAPPFEPKRPVAIQEVPAQQQAASAEAPAQHVPRGSVSIPLEAASPGAFRTGPVRAAALRWKEQILPKNPSDPAPERAVWHKGELRVLFQNGLLRAWRPEQGLWTTSVSPPVPDPFWPALSEDGSWVASSGRSPEGEAMFIWDASTGEIVTMLPAKHEPNLRFVRTPAGRVALALRNGLQIWDPAKRELLRWTPGQTLAFSSTGAVHLARIARGVAVEDLDSGELRAAAQGIDPNIGSAVSPDGRNVAVAVASGSVDFIDPSDGRIRRSEVLRAPIRTSAALAFSSDGTWIAAALDDKHLVAIDATTGAILADIELVSKARSLAVGPMAAVLDQRADVWTLDLVARV